MNEDQARGRFIVLQVVRLSGAAMAVAGLLVIAGKLDLPIEAGYGLFAVGLFETLLMPGILAQKWKSPPND